MYKDGKPVSEIFDWEENLGWFYDEVSALLEDNKWMMKIFPLTN